MNTPPLWWAYIVGSINMLFEWYEFRACLGNAFLEQATYTAAVDDSKRLSVIVS